MIDSHQHFWKFDPIRDAWINDQMKVIQRDFLPGDLAPLLASNGLSGSVAVQADQSETETHFLLSLASEHDFIKGVVGWIDLRDEKLSQRLEYFSPFKKLKGLRHIVQGEADGFLDQPGFLNGIRQLQRFDLTYDVLIYSRQLEEAIRFVKKFPNQKFVIDHIAKPVISKKEWEPWAKGMTEMARMENVYCKISGMVTEADWSGWTKDTFTPYLKLVFEKFGSKRILYGSDWPVCLVAASYQQQFLIVSDFLAQLSSSEKKAVMGENAVRFYNL
jgi:L-fuconolactonase